MSPNFAAKPHLTKLYTNIQLSTVKIWAESVSDFLVKRSKGKNIFNT